MDILIVCDMQNDFVTGSLGTPMAVSIVDNVIDRVRSFEGRIIFTRDTHGPGYLSTQEGRKLPVVHCIENSEGWQFVSRLVPLTAGKTVIDKSAFGTLELGEHLRRISLLGPVESITIVGLCTDICVITNAFLCKAFLPETPIRVDASCCAGVTLRGHRQALAAMSTCQIEIVNGEALEATETAAY